MTYRNGFIVSAALALAVATGAWATGDANVRAVHGSPGADEVDVLANDMPAFMNVAYTDVTDYLPVTGGEYNVKVVPAGQTEPILIEEDLAFIPYLRYTVAAVDEPAEIEALVLFDAVLVTPDQSMLRFVNLSPDSEELDLVVAGGDALFEGIEFKQTHEYIVLESGMYDLEIRDSDTGDLLLDLPGQMFEMGTAYTLFLFGLVDGAPALETGLAVDLFTCMGDAIPDGNVNVLDLLVVLATWGECPTDTCCPGDVNDDGVVDVLDLLAVLAAWGPCG